MSYFTDSRYVTEIDDDEFEDTNITHIKNNQLTAVLFYADWCPHCKNFKDTYESFARKALFMNVTAFNCALNKKWVLCAKERHENFVKTYPTIFFYYKGKPVKKFSKERTVKNLIDEAMLICTSTNESCEVR
ncbi:MAG TPA: protein disulfide isomerase family protein [Nitrosarchaeum sp.]|nr:protein disulfide isomerase family protein [Nitrosarchaeum sp.]